MKEEDKDRYDTIASELDNDNQMIEYSEHWETGEFKSPDPLIIDIALSGKAAMEEEKVNYNQRINSANTFSTESQMLLE
eukprot:CAMPEP_0170546052 /NCGR_PEP_ID=MMETSP0211-20121228/4422_1 /TAXON_ID=311385 /ORGANISM="Pseudokeronopsis sp., Strain OXSARD2" /LENGTH=78 /DNA_ID=CAMNT_0010850299 /DNA_START=355 /DNA_END=591 /DNA_ORIENTATION=+